jgi:ubiquinone biosynthesis protein UbiJ
MATQSPFSFLDSAFNSLAARLSPPPWAVHEVQHRVVLLLNHVLQQEPEAMARLQRQKGLVVLVQWRLFALNLVATPAGLLDVAMPGVAPDLTLTVTQVSPFDVLQKTLRGDKPEVRIEGDVQLAAEVNWLVDHVRWDVEEDLSKIVGDVMAHRLGQIGQGMASALRGFVANLPKGVKPDSEWAERRTAP